MNLIPIYNQLAPIRPFVFPSAVSPGSIQPATYSSDSFSRVSRPVSQASTQGVSPVSPLRGAMAPAWYNDLKAMFHRNEAVIYALNIRTFGAVDKNGDGRISSRLQEGGTFLSAISRLDELKSLGVNAIHLLPINPIGKNKRFGEAGSLYAPSDYHRLNPDFADPNSNLDVVQQARLFINECHKRGIHVMVDIPSCASYDLMEARPDLIARDENGKPLTPTNWVDVVMFQNGPALQEYYEGFFDLMVNQLGVDGFRADIARSRTPQFWRHFIDKHPDKAWLAETYCEEDQSPLPNLPRDRPESIMRSGFDSMYGQFHIFHAMQNAKEYINYLLENRAMFIRASRTDGNDKSFIGSFLTHDDPPLMEKGGVAISLLVSGLMATQPWTNPYILDGFTTGYKGEFDIFNYVNPHRGQNPEIGGFLRSMLSLRRQYKPVFTEGAFIPIPIQGEKNNQIIAFARQANGKTLLVVANKDVNARHAGTLQIPGLSPAQRLINLAPEYGQPSQFTPRLGELQVNLGPARFFVFEIDTPNLGLSLPAF